MCTACLMISLTLFLIYIEIVSNMQTSWKQRHPTIPEVNVSSEQDTSQIKGKPPGDGYMWYHISHRRKNLIFPTTIPESNGTVPKVQAVHGWSRSPSGMPPVLLGFACLARKSSKHILPNGAVMVMNPMVQPVENGLQQLQVLLSTVTAVRWSATTPFF